MENTRREQMCKQDSHSALLWRAPSSVLQPSPCSQPSKLCSTVLPPLLHVACSTLQLRSAQPSSPHHHDLAARLEQQV